MNNIKKLLSPRLIKLQNDIQSNGQKAIDEFWKELDENGTPIIESIEDDPKNVLSTFIAKDEDDIEKLVLITGIGGNDLSKKIFNKIENTNIYYISLKTPNRTRTAYRIAKNIPLDIFENAIKFQMYKDNFQPDPLNPKKIVFPENEEENYEEMVLSVIEVPDAPEQTWIQRKDNIPSGNLVKNKISSKLLDNERSVWVYTPDGYCKDGKPYNLLLAFDGFAYIHIVPTPTILDNLINEGEIPPTVAILVGNAKDKRDKELPCNERFADFLAKELLPWVHNNYNVTVDPSKSVIAGSSFGGIASTFMGLKYSNIFGNILSQSGSYWWHPQDEEEMEWLIKQYIKEDKLPLKFYLDVGTLETYHRMVLTNRHFRDILECKGYDYYYREFVGGHDYLSWRETLAHGLIELIGSKE